MLEKPILLHKLGKTKSIILLILIFVLIICIFVYFFMPKSNKIIAIACSNYHSIALDKAGNVFSWGQNSYGELGDGTTIDKNIPVQISALSKIKSIACGEYYSMALDKSGNVFSWGYNASGELGYGTMTDSNTPVKIATLSNITAIACGLGHSMALDSNGNVWSWGYNMDGEVGDGTTNNKITPIKLKTLNNITAIACGNEFSMALDSKGDVWAWGWNQYGQVGDGTTVKRYAPVKIATLSGQKITAIACGNAHSMALSSNGDVWAWGYNQSGQLGDGTTTGRDAPNKITALSGNKIIAISAGNAYSMALSSSKNLFSWGYNGWGQLGDGTTIDKSIPTSITSLNGKGIITMACGVGYKSGLTHSMALSSKGDVWAWGLNLNGQLGDGTTTNSSNPIKVITKLP